MGMRCTGSFKADFGQCIVRPPDLVGMAGDCYREPAFSAGAVRFAAVQQGGIEAVFDATREFLRRLKRTDERAKYAAALARARERCASLPQVDVQCM